jgi:7,8-dihydropterin-6-yl-methyl-4-(beta-D-ribofuranosyl)aminobenzene 5'-phosphate synthase
MTGYRQVRAVISTLFFVFYLFTLQCAPSGGKSSHTEFSPAAIVEQNSPSKTNIDPADEKITITVVYDNNEYDKRLETAWGFSCLVQGLEKTILFDTGGDGSMLISNMRKLGIDPHVVDVVIISHIHYDHVGGLPGFLKANHNVSVYLPEYLPKSIKDTVRESGAHLIEVSVPVKICRNVYSTGELGTWIKEQSMVIETTKGLIVITGCAHPGIVNIIREAKMLYKKRVYLAMGGFHLCWLNPLQIKGIVNGVKLEGVEVVAPCHCSGDTARRLFEKSYGEDFIPLGVGKVLELEN